MDDNEKYMIQLLSWEKLSWFFKLAKNIQHTPYFHLRVFQINVCTHMAYARPSPSIYVLILCDGCNSIEATIQ